MSVAAGASRQISHVMEVAAGTDPGTPYTIDRFLAGARLYNEADEIRSNEMRSDRAVAPGASGAKRVRFTGPFELSYGSHEDYLSSAFCSAWVAAGSANGSLTTTVVAGTTNTMGATGIGTGIAVGDVVKIAGFTAGNIGNNGYYRVTARTADLLTFGEAVNADGTSRLTACSSVSGTSSQKMGYLIAGSTEKSMSIESAATDINVFERGLGMEMNRFSLSIAQGAIITGSFEGVGLQMPKPQGTKYRTGTDVAASTTNPMTSNATKSFVWLDGSVLAVSTALSLNLDNGMEALIGLFQTTAYDILLGRSNLSGSITLAFMDSTVMAKAFDETRVALRCQMMDPTATNGYFLDIPSMKLALPSEDTQENKRFHTYNWQAERDSTSGLVNGRIWKLS